MSKENHRSVDQKAIEQYKYHSVTWFDGLSLHNK